jgi:D-alanyl-D-alanine carboxypeptidase/D-alanyl-D-alanine-endopeptidase (penicillin-binding protein 4)
MQIYAFLISIFFITSSFSQNIVEKLIRQFQSDNVNKNGAISFLALDIQTGEKIAQLNPTRALTCASVTKLFSSATALEVLGGDKTTKTSIYYSGKIDSQLVLNGDIWIRGGGDVTLGSRYFSIQSEELKFLTDWCDSLIRKGIRKVKGSVVADGSEFGYSSAPKGWHEDDIGNYYGAIPAGLNFYDNLIKVSLKTGVVGSKSYVIDVFPFVPNLNLINTVISANVISDESSISGLPYSLNRKITGRLPANQNKFIVKGSMPDPEYMLAHEFVRFLNSKGITVEGGAKSVRLSQLTIPKYDRELTLLFQHESKSIREIAFWTNVKSVNLYAEGLVKLLGYFTSGNGTTEAGLEVIRDFWKDKINTTNLVLNDGSGLSRMNAISAQHLCELLKFMSISSNFDLFKSTLPIAGKNGTISTLCKGGSGEGIIYAKSGTFKTTKSLAGYVDSKTGKKIAFAFVVNNFNCSSKQITNKMEKILNALAEY